jgi:tRNA (guanine-N(7)-)-methyltransferase
MENYGNIRTFGRVKSRKLSTKKQYLLQNLLPKYQIKNLQSQNFQIFNLEIGSGEGDFVFSKASNNPNQCFIACETHINSVANILSKLEKSPLDNLFIVNGDARDFLIENKLKFSNIFILNPDPWPKTKQQKRRLINDQFLQLIHKNMKKNSELIIVTDDNSYKSWIMEIFLRNYKLFYWHAEQKSDWLDFPQDWVWTKYQKKAISENRINVFLLFSNNY